MSYTVRNLTIAMALAVVGIILMVNYVHGQKAALQKGDSNIKVLVAKKDIPAGTSVKELKAGGFLETKTIVSRDRDPSAIGSLSGLSKLAVNSQVYAGQQLTSRVFQESGKSPLRDQLKGTERALMVPLNPWAGLGTYLRAGDHIDIYASNTIDSINNTWLVARNVEILKVPADMTEDGSPAYTGIPKTKGDPQPYVLKVTDQIAQDIFWSYSAANDDKLTVTLRGANGSLESRNAQPETSWNPSTH